MLLKLLGSWSIAIETLLVFDNYQRYQYRIRHVLADKERFLFFLTILLQVIF